MIETQDATISRLAAARERSGLLRWSAVLLVALAAMAWLGETIDAADLVTSRRGDNLLRFLSVDAVPPIVRASDEPLTALVDWLRPRLVGRNLDAALATLQLSVVAAALAALLGLLLAPLTARTVLGSGAPFEPRGSGEGRTRRRRVSRAAIVLCVLLRAVPEYMLAFLLGAVLPSPAWAAILALAIHNGGILGRLYGETFEHIDQAPARAWHGSGSTRLAAAVGAQLPAALPRLLTYFFYRLESCVRESTVLGMLGFVSLGYWIVQERAAGRYDEMLLLVGLGVVIVIGADLVSWVARTVVRRSA